MLNSLFSSVIGNTLTPAAFFGCTGCALILGFLLAAFYMFKNTYSKSFVVTVALLPVIVQVIMMLVNGNLGTGVAVMGAFSLIRFRSAPGTAREILAIFSAMAVGLATGVGYLGIATVFTVIIIAANLFYTAVNFGDSSNCRRELKITVPESLDYTTLFDDLFAQYTKSHCLNKVKTSNLGSLFQLSYTVELKSEQQEKAFLDALRCRNGNLDIVSSRFSTVREEL